MHARRPSLQWTEDEVHVLFAVTNEVHIFDGLTVDLKHPLQKLYSDVRRIASAEVCCVLTLVQGMVACSLAPGSSGAKFRVAVFKPEKKVRRHFCVTVVVLSWTTFYCAGRVLPRW